ncbi:MAG: MATE family efflux transporter [Saprospiraceae bacterium]
MSKNASEELGTKPISELIVSQSVPAAIGILVMSLNLVVDTIFVGNFIGPIAIAVITVVMPIAFFIASVGMAVGVGSASIISRAFGSNNEEKAFHTFGNQLILSFGLSILLAGLGLFFTEGALKLFGAEGEVMAPAKIYYTIVMASAPFLAMVMSGNPIIRAVGKPKFAMIAMIVPSFVNLLLDYILIVMYDGGIAGAGWATAASYFSSFLFILWFFTSDVSDLKIKWKCLRLQWPIVKEIGSLGGVTLARQGVVSLLAVILNNTLFTYGGGNALATYGIISRMLMFSLFPVMGIAQGYQPIAGYNYGAEKYGRVKETVNKSIYYATGIAILIFIVIMIFPDYIVRVFTSDPEILKNTPNALRTVFAITPLISVQLIGSSFFQAIGKAKPALFLSLSKQGFFLIPLIMILPNYFGLLGVWISFPIADFLSTALTWIYLRKEMRENLPDGV